MKKSILRLSLLSLATMAAVSSVQAGEVVLSEDFSGSTNIFGVSATEPASGLAWLQTTTLSGFDRVLAVCNTSAEGTISGADAQPVAFDDKMVTLEWDAFHGYLGNSRTSTVSLLNSAGQVLASYTYNCQKCQVTDAVIGGEAVATFEAFGLQNQNGFGGNGKPYTATGNPHIAITMTARGGVEMVFSKNGTVVKSVLGSLGTMAKNVAKMKVTSTVDNTDRCYAIDNIQVTTAPMAVDPDYVEAIASVAITGADRMTFGPSADEAYSNTYAVTIVGTDGTTITEDNLSQKVTDFRVVWDIEGFKTANDTEGQYCDSYGRFSVNGQGRVQTTFDLRDVPMNFFGRMTATVTYNGTTHTASKYVVAQGHASATPTQVLPLPGYPASFSAYPDVLVGYTVTKDTYGAATDLLLGGWCVAGSDAHSAKLAKDADGTKYVRITSQALKKSHVITKTIDSPTAQLIFRNRLRFNNAGAVVTLTGGYPFWSSSRYTCPVSLSFDGAALSLNGTAVALDGQPVQLATGTWYDIVVSADKSSQLCYAMVYDTQARLLGQSGPVAWQEESSPTYFSIGMNNNNIGSVDMASYEAFTPTIDQKSYTLVADKTTLSIPQGESARLVATLSDVNGLPITAQATWTVLEEDMRQHIVITPDASDSHQATLSLLPTAEAGTATVQVSIGGSAKTAALSLTSLAESVKFLQSTTSITIPLDADKTATATFEAVVIDSEGHSTDAAVTLSALQKDAATPFASTDAISFDAATGLLSVTAAAQPVQMVIRATGQNSEGQEISKDIKVNIHGLKFDFGLAADDAVAEGFTPVSATTAYTDQNGYGITSGTATAGGDASATDATADYLEGAIAFDFKASKGDFYTVEITYQGVLTTGHINSDLAGYQLASSTEMTTATLTIPATTDVIDLHIAHADATHVARIAQVTITKQAKRQKRTKPAVRSIGDSTAANNGSWAYRLQSIVATEYPELAGLCDFYNNGRGGRNLSTYYTEGMLAGVLRNICPGDVIILGNMGTNGMGSNFEADMNYYLDAAEALGAKVILNSYTPHGAVANYTGGYNASTHTFDSYRRDSYETVVRRVAAERAAADSNYLGFVEIGKNADAAFNAYVADYATNGYASADAAAQAIIACFTDHNHYSNGTLACDLMLGGYDGTEGIVAQLVSKLRDATTVGIDTTAKTAPQQKQHDVYTIAGQRVGKPQHPGLYIVGGRKVVVR